jgi:hypothetical protein
MTPDSSFWDFPGFSLHMWSIKQHFNVSLISGFKPRFIYILRRHIKQNEQSIKLVSFYCCIDLYNGNISVKVVVILNSLKVTSTILEWNNLQMLHIYRFIVVLLLILHPENYTYGQSAFCYKVSLVFNNEFLLQNTKKMNSV